MSRFTNRGNLTDHGETELRNKVLDILDWSLHKSDPGIATKDLVRLEDEVLSVGYLELDLELFKKIIVIGAGKASYPIAKALEDILGSRISGGIVVSKDGHHGKLNYACSEMASHPIPDDRSFGHARTAMEFAARTGPRDLVFACFTGGSSALMSMPAPGIPFKDKILANKILLSCGANIVEVNAVRKHLSGIKGGRLAQLIHPEAVLINLTVSDVIGDPLDCVTDLTVPDSSSFEDAKNTLTRYDLWEKMPASITGYLLESNKERETPKTLDDRRIESFMLVNPDSACDGAAEKAMELGLEPFVLTTMLEGESREAGRILGCIAKEILRSERPVKPPCALICGGETTVTLDKFERGSGGPNQEFTIGAALEISGCESVVVAGFDTDGTDGPTSYAGGIADGHSVRRAVSLGIDMHRTLKEHTTSETLGRLNDLLITGNTGTNVNDVKILVIG